MVVSAWISSLVAFYATSSPLFLIFVIKHLVSEENLTCAENVPKPKPPFSFVKGRPLEKVVWEGGGGNFQFAGILFLSMLIFFLVTLPCMNLFVVSVRHHFSKCCALNPSYHKHIQFTSVKLVINSRFQVDLAQ